MTGTLGGTVVAGKRTICVHCHDLYRSHAINEVTKKIIPSDGNAHVY